mmetsp:Transcript_3781/g.13441  ORF Transcript_3781/g.13441 Transcript_3781/m.13441 type:complete len:478 (-) Transcript_3781:814-2247(-)
MNAIVTPAAKTPAIPEPAKKPAATNCDKLSNESLFLRLHDPDKNAPKKTITENSGGMMNAIPNAIGLGTIFSAKSLARAVPLYCILNSKVLTRTANKAAKTLKMTAWCGTPTALLPSSLDPVNTSATAFHANAEGAGYSSPPNSYVRKNNKKEGTAPSTPNGTPNICAINCVRGGKRKMDPHLKSCIKSPACPAPPHATAAVTKFAINCPGSRNAKMSWMILPIGPIGFISVSPAHRIAMYVMNKPTGIDMMEVVNFKPKRILCETMELNTAKSKPVIHQFRGTFSSIENGVAESVASLSTSSESCLILSERCCNSLLLVIVVVVVVVIVLLSFEAANLAITIALNSCENESTAINVTPGHNNNPLAPFFMLNTFSVSETHPLDSARGPIIPHAIIAPAKTEYPTFSPINIPPPTKAKSNRIPNPRLANSCKPKNTSIGGFKNLGNFHATIAVANEMSAAQRSDLNCFLARSSGCCC